MATGDWIKCTELADVWIDDDLAESDLSLILRHACASGHLSARAGKAIMQSGSLVETRRDWEVPPSVWLAGYSWPEGGQSIELNVRAGSLIAKNIEPGTVELNRISLDDVLAIIPSANVEAYDLEFHRDDIRRTFFPSTADSTTSATGQGRWTDAEMREAIASCGISNRDAAWRDYFGPQQSKHGWSNSSFRLLWSEARGTKGMIGRPEKRA